MSVVEEEKEDADESMEKGPERRLMDSLKSSDIPESGPVEKSIDTMQARHQLDNIEEVKEIVIRTSDVTGFASRGNATKLAQRTSSHADCLTHQQTENQVKESKTCVDKRKTEAPPITIPLFVLKNEEIQMKKSLQIAETEQATLD